MRSFGSTIILLVLAAALGVGLYLTSGDPEPTGEITESALDGRRLLTARRITIRGQAGVQPIEFERGDTLTFRMTEPLRDLASQARLRALASAWDTARLVQAYKPDEITEEYLAQTGLDDPEGELVAEFDDHTVRIELGAPGPLGQTVFARKNGTIYQMGRAAITTLEGTPDDFREALVFRSPAAAVRSVSIVHRRGEETVRLSFRRTADGRFELTEPLTARADAAAAQAVINGLLGLVASGFPRGNVHPQPAKADARIEISGDAGTEVIELWHQPAQMMLGHQSPRDLDFVLPAETFRRLFELPVEQMRSAVLIYVPPDQATEIRIDAASGAVKPIVFRRGAQTYLELREPVRSATHATAVGKLLEALRLLTAIEFVDSDPEKLAEYGLDRDYVVLSVMGPLGRRPEVVHVSRPVGEVCYARRADEPFVVAIPPECGAALHQPWTAYVDRKVYAGLPDQITAVRVSRGTDAVLFTRGGDGAWRREGRDPALDDFGDAVSELADLRAEAVLEPTAVADLGDPVSIELRTGDTVLQRFAVWRQGDRVLVRVSRLDVVFRLGRLTSASILPWLP